MPAIKSNKGKKRALEETPPIKKPKRAETKPCPVCKEPIPIRLLHAHSVLELQRVDDIIKSVGSTEVLDDDREEGPSTKTRRSALKARTSLRAMHPRNGTATDTHLLHAIKRRRKLRHARLRFHDDDHDEGHLRDAEMVCPVCMQVVRGDTDVAEAHIDACLAHASREEEEGEMHLSVLDGVNVRGTGFDTRNRDEQDVEDEVDIDGDDEAVFGDAQFTEGDILGLPSFGEDDATGSTLRDLVAKGKVVTREGVKAKIEEVMGLGDADRMDLAILTARRNNDTPGLLLALENKIKQLESMRISSTTSLLCRICLDPYTEPTASTGCWHTCCRECWLRCLGSTKLCPICKRITAATELRRVFL
ncbi:hypothetical protein PLICRDRAFT_169723 [Plicaturopsis crispa FD-325 SS-3]|nr:hypothetical protein PLICRDRAFT_169723 [Plicaturopsis crispa FD-325 SS-3]